MMGIKVRNRWLGQRFFKKALSVILVFMMMFAGIIPANPGRARAEENTSLFQQGAGYQEVLYDSKAEQPTVTSLETLQIPTDFPIPSAVKVFVEQTTIDADGAYELPLFVEVDDQYGNPMGNQDVELSLNGPGGLSTTYTRTTTTNEETGYSYVAYHVPAQTGEAQITAKIGNLVSDPLTLSLVTPSAASFTWYEREVSIGADGSTTQGISGTVYDHNYVPLPGQIVSFSLLGSGSLSSTRAVSQGEYGYGPKGSVQANIIASPQVGEGILKATVGGVESTPLSIHFVEPIPKIIYWNSQGSDTVKLDANGQSTWILEAVVSDKPAPWWTEGRLSGQEVKFTLTGPGSLSQEIAVTDSNGISRVILTAPTIPGEASVVASVGELKTLPLLIDYVQSDTSGTAKIQSVSLSPDLATLGQAVQVKIKLSERLYENGGIYADLKIGSNQSRSVWSSYDINSSAYVGEYIVNQSDLEDLEQLALSISSIQFYRDGQWEYYYANKDFVSPSVALKNSTLNITLEADKNLLISDGRTKADLTTTVKDQNGNPIPNAHVQLDFFLDNQPYSYERWDVLTDSEGKEITQFHSPYTPGNVHIIANVGGVRNAEDLMIPCEAPVPTTIRVNSEKRIYDADGNYVVPLSIDALDQSGSPLQGVNVELTSTGLGQLTSPSTWVWSDWAGEQSNNSPQVFYKTPSAPGKAQIIAHVGELQSESLELTFETPQVLSIQWSQKEVSLSIGELSQIPLQAYVLDRNGAGLSNQSISFELQGPGTLNQSVGVSRAGEYGGQGVVQTGIIAPNEPGEALLVAHIGDVQSEPLLIHYVEAIPESITWSNSEGPIYLNADGKSSVDLTALVLDQTQAEWGSFGHAGEIVQFTLNGPGYLSDEITGTDVQGIAKVTLIAPDAPGSTTLTASIGDLKTPPLIINFVENQIGELKLQIADDAMVQESVPSLAADGTGKVPVEAQLTDTTGKPMAHQIVQFSNSEGLSFDAITGMTDDNGMVLVYLIAPSAPLSVTIQVSCGDVVTSRLVYFDTPKAGKVSWGIDDQILGKEGQVITPRGFLEADGTGRGKAFVIVEDGNGQPLSGVKVHFRLEGDGTLEEPDAFTDLNGRAEVKILAPSQVGDAKVYVEIPEIEKKGFTNLFAWDLEYVPPTPGEILLTALNQTLGANGQDSTELMVTVKDHHGVPLGDQNVLLWQNGSGFLDQIQVKTGTDGKGSVKLTAPTVAGYAWFIASVANIRSEPLKVEYISGKTSELEISTTVLPAVFQGTDYQADLKASGGSAPYQWVATGLPEGLTLNPSGLMSGDANQTGIFPIEITVTDASGKMAGTELILTVFQKSIPQYTAKPYVNFEDNPLTHNAGMLIGLQSILDLQGEVLSDRKLAGYKIELDYDPEKVQILDVLNESNFGHFYANRSQPGKITIIDAGDGIVTALNRLAFVSLVVKGSALVPTPVVVKFLEMSDQENQEISLPDPQILLFQRGKVVSSPDGTRPKISDAVGALQYLSGITGSGTDAGKVNLIDFASISQSEIAEQKLQADIKDVISLIQYLVDLRDDAFQLK